MWIVEDWDNYSEEKEESSKQQLFEEDMGQKDMALWSFIIQETLGDPLKSGIKPL